MKRRQALHIWGGMAASVLLSENILPNSGRSGKWLPAFAERWKVAVDYSLKILDAMPEADIHFQPITEQKPFGLHFSHIAYWNAFYAGSINGIPPLAEPENPDKEAIKAYFEQSSEAFSELILSLDESDLYKKASKGKALWGEHPAYWEEHTVMDFLLRAYMHTTHHRAQAIVYLRLKGLEPPFFMF